jgi:hypothetical protein
MLQKTWQSPIQPKQVLPVSTPTPRSTAHFVRDGDKFIRCIVRWLAEIRMDRARLEVPPHQLLIWERQVGRFISPPYGLFPRSGEPPLLRVFRLMKWYRHHYDDDKYIPVVESPRSPRAKFERLEAAMRRRTGG